MSLLSLFRSLLASSLRRPATLFFSVLIVAISVAAAAGGAGERTCLTVAVVPEDHGEAETRLLASLSDLDAFSMEVLSREEALMLLKKGKVDAVAVILDGFSAKIASADFSNSIEVFTSPTNSAAAAITEPLINGILAQWMEEFAIQETGSYLRDRGLVYSEADEIDQRGKIAELWENGSVVQIINTRAESATPREGASGSPLAVYTKWFGILCLFSMVIGAGWAQDYGKTALIVRIEQTGARLWSVILVSAAATAIVSFGAYIIGGIIVCSVFGCDAAEISAFLLSMILYLCGLAGVTLFLASTTRSIVGLMFLAPVATFFNGVMSGLFVDLPPWAYVLEVVSSTLPGRWLSAAGISKGQAALGGAVCASAWIFAGIAAAYARKKARIR